MLFKSVRGQVPVQPAHGLSQMPPCRREYQEVVHVADIYHMTVALKIPVRFCQVKCSEERTERTAAGNTLRGRVKHAALLNAVVKELVQQIQKQRGTDVFRQLRVQGGPADMSVITPDVRTTYPGPAPGQRPGMRLPD